MKFLLLLFLLFSCNFGSSNRSKFKSRSSSAVRAISSFELKHFVDPESGNITEKLSVPRNYNGNLYLAIDNIDKLVDKHLYVKMSFGHDSSVSPVILPATISNAPSISPEKMQPVLIVNLGRRPFLAMNLKYDLYDYNTYNFTSNVAGVELNNRDKDLYCRGLLVKDDPTFEGKECSGAEASCLYSYAKVIDNSWTSLSPSSPQIALDGGVYAADSESSFLQKCYSDELTQSFLSLDENQELVTQTINYSENLALTSGTYQYLGPYRAVDESLWQISNNAIWGAKGLFLNSLIPLRTASSGYQSLLFPRYSKLSIKSGVEHIGAPKPGEPGVLQATLDSDGKTFWMSGCNLRTITRDLAGHHMGSCNITSVIEVFYYDDGEEAVVASTAWDGDSRHVKLQLLQDGNLKDNGPLSPSYRSCSNNSGCADNECCFNGRCWSDELVAQCIPNGGGSMRADGETCDSDFDCFSLCCKENTCSPHNPANSEPTYCEKEIAESCVASTWCSITTINRTKIIKTGLDPDDCQKQTCAIPAHNDCVNNICQTRSTDLQDDYPDWQPGDCTDAVALSPGWTCE